MIIKLDFGNDYIQYISCSTRVGRKFNKIEREFLDWVFNENKNKKNWIYDEDWEGNIPDYDAHLIVEWLNNVKFKKRNAKATVIENPTIKPKKTVYF